MGKAAIRNRESKIESLREAYNCGKEQDVMFTGIAVGILVLMALATGLLFLYLTEKQQEGERTHRR